MPALLATNTPRYSRHNHHFDAFHEEPTTQTLGNSHGRVSVQIFEGIQKSQSHVSTDCVNTENSMTINNVGRLWHSDYGTNPDNRRSRAGFLGYLNVNLIRYNSALQRGNTRPFPCDGLRSDFNGVNFAETVMDDEPLSSMSTGTCDAEYMTLSLAVKELISLYGRFGHLSTKITIISKRYYSLNTWSFSNLNTELCRGC